MPSKKTRPVLYELVRRNKAHNAAQRATPDGNGVGNTDAVKPVAVSLPKREPVRFGRSTPPASAQTPFTRVLAQFGPTGIAAICAGTLLVILLLVQAWAYLSRPHDTAENRPENAVSTLDSTAGNNPRLSSSTARDLAPIVDPAPSSGSRAQLPPFAGGDNREANRQQNAANTGGSDRNTPPPVDPRPQPRNESNIPANQEQKQTAPPAPPPSEPVQWDTTLQKGRHYVVVAHYKKSDLALAQHAAAFLQERGIPCIIHEIRNAYMVVATQPFLINQKDAPARKAQQARADEFKRRIRALGKEHSRGSGNAFDQCYERLF